MRGDIYELKTRIRAILTRPTSYSHVGLPFYHEWAWQDDGVTIRYAFPNGFKGLVEICENYLTPENLKKVIDAKAFDSESMNTVLQGTKQSVDGWK
jgi:hypothetical protein